jgi:glutamyl-tRNA synthetase
MSDPIDPADKAAQKKAEKERAKAERKAKAKEHKATATANSVADQLSASSLQSPSSTAAQPAAKAKKQGANYNIGLKDTRNGIVTRFPPEPSGYLHIGHAKAACLNDFFAHKYVGEDGNVIKGKLILRFDDTNPELEKEEFQDAIKVDLAKLEITPDEVTYTSDYFQVLYEYCVQMIKSGFAYADDTAQEVMKKERWEGVASARRDMSVEDSLARFEEMKTGSEEGQKWVIRAKISIDSSNRALRDPTIYRVNMTPHHRTGTTWKVYPIYHFAVPIVDSVEGVTHALRTIEYRDWNAMYEWTLKVLKLRKVHIWDFSRLNFIRTLLSKRKLKYLVDKGAVSGWDDPRFPTVRGILRRGLTVPALHEFMISQGPSKNITLMDWTILWTMNKRMIDPIAPRHTAITTKTAVICHVKGARDEPYSEDRPKHPKNAEVGMRKMFFSNSIFIEQEDAKTFAKDEEITLMSWGNAFVRNIERNGDDVTQIELELHLEGDFKKTEKKVTWLSRDQTLVDVVLIEYDYLLKEDKLPELAEEDKDDWEKYLTPETEFKTEAMAECNVIQVKADDIVQFERKGFFRCDKAATERSPAIFFEIPSGRSK